MIISIEKNRGYFTLIVALLLITVAFTSLVVSYEYSDKSMDEAYSYSSMQAYYLAKSGLESAKHEMIINKQTCETITGSSNFTNATYTNAPGEFTVTSASSKTGSSLTANISATATTIPIVSASSFLSSGTVAIDSEIINYTGKTATSLTGAIRGSESTTAATHFSNAAVSQNVCVLTAVGGVPSLGNPMTKRTIQDTLTGNTFASGISGNLIYQAAMVVGGNVSLQGNATIINPTVTTQSPNFSGSTIVSGGVVFLTSSSITQVSDGSGGYVTVSNKTGKQADIRENFSQVNSSNIWSNFFSQSKATIQSSANQTYNSSNINGATGQTIWTGSLSLGGGTTIGSSTNPTILIINGDLDTSSGTTIYGMVYVTGIVTIHGSTNINGLFAVEGGLSTNGNLTVTYNPSLLSLVGNNNSSVVTTYSSTTASSQELFN